MRETYLVVFYDDETHGIFDEFYDKIDADRLADALTTVKRDGFSIARSEWEGMQ